MLIPSSVDFVPAAGGGGGPRSYTRMGSLVSACVCDLDATLVSSFSGGGSQKWFNLETQPADGEPQSGYDMFVGETIATATNDPTFTGSADAAGSYFALDGGDFFQTVSGNSNFIDKMHQPAAMGGVDWGVVFVGYSGNFTVTSGFFGTTNAALNKHGIGVWVLSTEVIRHRQVGQTSVDHDSSAAIPSSAANFFCVITHSQSTNKSRYFINKGSSEEAGHTYVSSNTPGFPFQICASGSAAFVFNTGMRIKAFSMFNKYLTASDVSAIMTEYGTRHSITYI